MTSIIKYAYFFLLFCCPLTFAEMGCNNAHIVESDNNRTTQIVYNALDKVKAMNHDAEENKIGQYEGLFREHVAQLTKTSDLGSLLLTLQDLVDKGDGVYWTEAQGVLYYICAHMNSSVILESVLPYMENASLNQDLQSQIDEILSLSSMNNEGKRFKRWEPYLYERREEPPENLIVWMYKNWIDSAFLTLSNVYTEKGTDEHHNLLQLIQTLEEWESTKSKVGLTVEQMQSNKREAISKFMDLGGNSRWWVQLYVAEKMKQNPKLRDPKLIEKLKKSKNPIVNATVQEIVDEKK